jgi:tetratricopeptide (TPR) repeat protein
MIQSLTDRLSRTSTTLAYLGLACLVLGQGACQPKGPNDTAESTRNDSLALRTLLRSGIDSLEKVLSADSLGISPQTAPLDSLAATCLRFASDFPRDPYAPVALWKAAQVLRSLGDVEGAVQCGKALVDAYPAHPLAPIALYFNAVVLNEDVGVQEAAAFYLERLTNEYPGDSLAKDAALYRQTLGMKQEDWNKRLKEQN